MRRPLLVPISYGATISSNLFSLRATYVFLMTNFLIMHTFVSFCSKFPEYIENLNFSRSKSSLNKFIPCTPSRLNRGKRFFNKSIPTTPSLSTICKPNILSYLIIKLSHRLKILHATQINFNNHIPNYAKTIKHVTLFANKILNFNYILNNQKCH